MVIEPRLAAVQSRDFADQREAEAGAFAARGGMGEGGTFRGQEHHVQMTTPPGYTVRVNQRGEPRA